MSQLVQAMARFGKEDMLLGTVEDFTSPESQKAVRSAFKTMTDSEIHEFVKNTPMSPLAEAMLARDEKGRFKLSEKDRKQFRQMIEDSILEDISLLDPLVGDYLDAKGEKNTQKARKKVIDEARQAAMADHLENFKKSLAEGEGKGEDMNKDRSSTEDLRSMLEAAGRDSRNAVIDLVLNDDNAPETPNAAIARAVREEGSAKAMQVPRVTGVPDERRPPGAVWGTAGEFYAKTPDGRVVGPFQEKPVADSWAAGGSGRKLAGLFQDYDFVPWPELPGSSA
jgi:hypothetical protein